MRSAAPTRNSLPGILTEIAAATSAQAALKIAAAHGGTRVYIPAAPSATHWLSQLVGHGDALAIGAALVAAQGGLDLLIPMNPGPKAQAWRRIKTMIDEKVPVPQIARACGVHMRTVQLHKKGELKRVSASLSQPDLFHTEPATRK